MWMQFNGRYTKRIPDVAHLTYCDRLKADPGFRVPVFFQTRKPGFLCPKTRVIGFIFGEAYSVVVAQNILHLGARDERKARRSLRV